jgi:hypothetical protein
LDVLKIIVSGAVVMGIATALFLPGRTTAASTTAAANGVAKVFDTTIKG